MFALIIQAIGGLIYNKVIPIFKVLLTNPNLTNFYNADPDFILLKCLDLALIQNQVIKIPETLAFYFKFLYGTGQIKFLPRDPSLKISQHCHPYHFSQALENGLSHGRGEIEALGAVVDLVGGPQHVQL